MKGMKKLLTLILSLSMAFSLCLTISADGEKASMDGKGYSTLQDAINAANGDAQIDLLADTTENITVANGKKITLNLKGKTLTGGSNGDTIYVEKGAELTIVEEGTGSVIATNGGYATIFNNGTTYLKGGNYKRNETSKWYIVVNHGNMTIDGSKIESTNTSDTSSAVENGYSNYTDTNHRKGYVENTNEANPTLTIKSSSTHISTEAGSNAVKNDDGGVLTIDKGSFEAKNEDGAVIQNWNVATINDGIFTSNGAVGVISDGAYDNSNVNKGQLTINGGTFVQNDTNKVVFAYGVGASTPEFGIVKVTAGTFTGKAVDGISYKLKISGGTYSTDVTKYLESDKYNAVKNSEGKYVVVEEGAKVEVKEDVATTPALEETAYNETKSAVKTLNQSLSEDQKITFNQTTKVELKSNVITETSSEYPNVPTFTKEQEEKVEEKVVESVSKEVSSTVDTNNIELIPLDITLNIVNTNQDGTTKEDKITTILTNPITVTLYLNDNTLSKLEGKIVKVIRIHKNSDGNEEITVLPATLKNNALSFKTDRFSTYVIASYSVPSTSSKTYSYKDKNQDGIISCEEEMNNANWIWSESKGACVYKVSNTSTK